MGTARGNIKSHPKIGANSRRNKLYQYGSASKFKRSEIVSIHEEEEEEKLVQMTAKAAMAEISFHGKRYNDAMNHLKDVEVLNDESLKDSPKPENEDYFVTGKIFVTLLALEEGKSGKSNALKTLMFHHPNKETA